MYTHAHTLTHIHTREQTQTHTHTHTRMHTQLTPRNFTLHSEHFGTVPGFLGYKYTSFPPGVFDLKCMKVKKDFSIVQNGYTHGVPDNTYITIAINTNL